MDRIEAQSILKKAVEGFDKPAGELYFVSLGEDKDNYYFDVCSIPPNAHIDWKTDKQISNRCAISPPWYVNKKTGAADINWGMPDDFDRKESNEQKVS